jgi:hypothetical protein
MLALDQDFRAVLHEQMDADKKKGRKAGETKPPSL